MKFTDAQLEAINHATGNLQLIACAGSGKTEVVARRVVELLRPGRAHSLLPRNIIAFTFTEKAAAELKDRISERVREELGELPGLAEMYVGTIHAFCLELLKTEVPEYLKYEVLNEVQQGLFIDRNSSKSGLTTSKDIAGSNLKRYRDTKNYVSALSILRESELDEDALEECSLLDGLEKFRDLLTDKDYLDYSEILVRSVAALEADAELRQRLSSRVKHVIVDEYQDVNPIQEKIVRHLHDLGAFICVVGDDDQTIYQWRGSDVRNILTFSSRYPNVAQVRLQENFRSSEGIIDVARNFILRNQERLPKEMESTSAQPYEDGDIVATGFDTVEAEAEYIVKTIKNLRGVEFTEKDHTRGITYSDCTILLRSVKKNAKPITDALRAEGIPFIVTGMNNLFETAEAEAARQLFYFLANRPEPSRAALKAAWVAADIGVSPSQIERAIKNAEVSKDAIWEGREKRFGVYNLQRSFLSFLEDMELREESITGKEGDHLRGEVIFYNLGKFSQLISDFETIHFHSDPARKYEEFANFLQYRADEAYPEGWLDNQYANPDAVRIMTVHQAKGMQWPVVFLPALVRNRFPSMRIGGRTVWHMLPREGVVGQDRYEGNIEDERRLFYVGVTRSQKFLFLTWAPVNGNKLYQKASEFWENVLISRYVKRRRFDYSDRPRTTPEPKSSVSNVVFSFSDLKYFFECPYQFKLRILYGFNPPIHEALGYGKSLHDALAEVHKSALEGKMPDPTDVSRLLATHLHLPYAYPTLKATLEESATKVLKKYFDDNRELLKKIEFAEKGIEVHLGDGVTVAGRVDLIRRIDTGEVTIVDLKSSDRAQPEEVTETQLHIYALGYQELTGRNADLVEIYELDQGKRVPRSVDDGLLAEVTTNVKKAGDALRKGAFPVTPSPKRCGSCDYLKLCTAGGRAVKSEKA